VLDVRQGGAHGPGAGRTGRPPVGCWPVVLGPPEKSGPILVVFKAGLYRSNRGLVNPGQNLKSGITAPQKKSGTILVENVGL
jgi:hypothetical protein